MKDKIRLAVIFGGKSAEHEVSLQSAKNVIDAVDREKYALTLIGIDKSGQWYLNDESMFLLNAENPESIRLKSGEKTALVPLEGTGGLINLSKRTSLKKIDVVFPVLHGSYGEDGAIQGFLKMAGIPFVGANIAGSSVGMDKDIMKRLLRDAGIAIADFIVLHRNEKSSVTYEKTVEKLGTPLFIKPANLGSSVGINKADDSVEFKSAVDDAFRYDSKIIIEEFIQGREIECAVLGNEEPIASVPGEIIPRHDFYSYEAKYLDESGALLEAPAKLPEDTVKKVQKLAIKAFKTLCCEGMARVDMFLRDDNELILNEINTIPGFTRISMYPKLWELSGLPYPELIDRLIRLALERKKREDSLDVSYDFGHRSE